MKVCLTRFIQAGIATPLRNVDALFEAKMPQKAHGYCADAL
jgi:hypothetical protein